LGDRPNTENRGGNGPDGRQGSVRDRRGARPGQESRGPARERGGRHDRRRHLPQVRVVTAEVDVRDSDALRAAVDSGLEQLGRSDVIVANAGIGTRAGRLHKIDEALWQGMIDVNLGGVRKTVKAGVPTSWTAAAAAPSF
jgi:NAD(P)-dependent dehydrogenase (short-subunit alcohol dehydrogenase family)